MEGGEGDLPPEEQGFYGDYSPETRRLLYDYRHFNPSFYQAPHQLFYRQEIPNVDEQTAARIRASRWGTGLYAARGGIYEDHDYDVALAEHQRMKTMEKEWKRAGVPNYKEKIRTEYQKEAKKQEWAKEARLRREFYFKRAHRALEQGDVGFFQHFHYGPGMEEFERGEQIKKQKL